MLLFGKWYILRKAANTSCSRSDPFFNAIHWDVRIPPYTVRTASPAFSVFVVANDELFFKIPTSQLSMPMQTNQFGPYRRNKLISDQDQEEKPVFLVHRWCKHFSERLLFDGESGKLKLCFSPVLPGLNPTFSVRLSPKLA